MNYITYDKYVEVGGILDSAAFERYSMRAFSRISQETHNRINAMKIVPGEVLHLCRDLIEYLHNNVNQDKSVLSESQSQGGASESVSYINKSTSDIEKEIEDMICDYLASVSDDNGTPLLYRGCM